MNTIYGWILLGIVILGGITSLAYRKKYYLLLPFLTAPLGLIIGFGAMLLLSPQIEEYAGFISHRFPHIADSQPSISLDMPANISHAESRPPLQTDPVKAPSLPAPQENYADVGQDSAPPPPPKDPPPQTAPTEKPTLKDSEIAEQVAEPLPAATPLSQADSQQTLALQSPAPQAVSPDTEDPINYPYTIHLFSFREPHRAVQAVNELLKEEELAYTTFLNIPGKGNWFRVYVGLYETLESAELGALILKTRKFKYTKVIKVPYTICLGTFASTADLTELKSQYAEKGLIPYPIPENESSGRLRLMVGGFETKALARAFLKTLPDASNGALKVVLR